MSAQSKPAVKSLSCPNCGGTVELRGMGRTQSVVCIQCLTVIDTSTPSLQVIQQFQAKERYRPLIPLGTRGKMRGDLMEVIGMQVREMEADGVAYHWTEYVLFNPYKGFRYLTEYNGHWNDVKTLQAIPTGSGASPVSYLGTTYKHFQHYEASTTYVMGEFPWKVRVGETAVCDDYIAPPLMLSSERSDKEVTWSMSEYTAGETIWQNFQLKGSPPKPAGVFANQPAPVADGPAKAWGRFFFWLLVLVILQALWTGFHAHKTVFSQKFSFAQQVTGGGEHSFVTEAFDVPGRTSSLEVDLTTDLHNNWAYFQLALINVDSGTAFDFSRQVSYYTGRDEDGNWSEGKGRDSVVLPTVPSGRYYLRVEPEMDTSTPKTTGNSVNYEIKVIRDVTTWAYFWIGALLLLIPPVWKSFRGGSFELQRWAESDYAGGSSGKGDEE